MSNTSFPAGPAAVSVRDVVRAFGDFQALKGVSLDIRRGEFFSLLGPSGCGKTTLLRIIGGFEAPTSGTVEIDGKSVLGQPPYARSTNMIFQNLALFPHLSVFENVAFSLRLRKQPKAEVSKRVEELLRLVHLPGYSDRMINQLSGGQRQRVALARALVNEPSVLLLDEPLGALDLQLRLQMQEELRRIQRSFGNTFIFVTHDQAEAMSMSDRIAVMNEGEIVQVGTPEAIYNQPATRFVARFIGHANLLEGVVIEHDSKNVKFVCDGLMVVANMSEPLSVGQKVTGALRFERVSLTDAQGAVRANVTERRFLGGCVRLTARTDTGATISADIPTSGYSSVPDVGATVRLAWTPADVQMLVR
jgi:spermidine/putrescine transport system ATP-binding protein